MSSSRELYKRFVNLSKKWPKDETKAGRDYGEYFRNQITEFFPQGEHSRVENTQKVRNSITALENIANDLYHQDNPLRRSSASGLDRESCRMAISNEGIKCINDEDESSLLSRLKSVLSVNYLRSPADDKVSPESEQKKIDEK